MASFELIPVIDLKGGLVVHARAGERASYRPLQGSVLVDSPEPETVVRALLDLHPFRALYIADLDAIEKRGDHKAQIRALRATFPGLRLWVDAGFSALCPCRRFLEAGVGDLVLGTESQDGPDLLQALRGEPRLVLSLDFKGDRALGPPALFADPASWPKRVVVMTLARVGAATGPDLERLRAVRARAPGKRVYAAGGVRGEADLQELKALGCAGVLLASALHDGRVGAAALERLAG